MKSNEQDILPNVRAEPAAERRAKRKELLLFLFITVVMFPVLSVLIVASYGFSVWFWQIFTGPPTH